MTKEKKFAIDIDGKQEYSRCIDESTVLSTLFLEQKLSLYADIAPTPDKIAQSVVIVVDCAGDMDLAHVLFQYLTSCLQNRSWQPRNAATEDGSTNYEQCSAINSDISDRSPGNSVEETGELYFIIDKASLHGNHKKVVHIRDAIMNLIASFLKNHEGLYVNHCVTEFNNVLVVGIPTSAEKFGMFSCVYCGLLFPSEDEALLHHRTHEYPGLF